MTNVEFVNSALQIVNRHPEYKHGHSGSDGFCDCIGLVIGAITECGGNWSGIHGSNWAARNALVSLNKIANPEKLETGDLVFKAYDEFDANYDLPSRYANHPDQHDYYHVGIVVQSKPLAIVHMTSPSAKTDNKIGEWRYHGKLKMMNGKEGEKVVADAVVVLPKDKSGATVNMRKTPDGELITRVPVGARVVITEDKGDWCQINYSGKVGWMMSNYLDYIQDDHETDEISPADKENIETALLTLEKLAKDILTQVDAIGSIVGRG